MITGARRPAASRSSKGANTAKTAATFEALVRVAPEKPTKVDRVRDPRGLARDARGLARHRIGALQAGAVGELDAHDRVALVLLGNEAGGHVLESRNVTASSPA